MKLYNTMTRNKEEFAPIDGKTVRMYSCGPTVYNFAHIGNMRTYIFMDLLTRAIKLAGLKVKSVMNITDVGHLLSDGDSGEDKMEKAAKEQKKTPFEIAEYYTNVFFDDLKKLNIERPNVVPKATDHIPEMIEVVKTLIDKGYAYETSDGIYFEIAKFADYGKLSRLNLEEQLEGARVEVNEEKRAAHDFALWKKAEKEHIMQWESPWGMGYPGWHIECTAMSRKYLGDTFDIHSGGVDHIPVHHENEIAQGEALTGKNPANFWIHGEFMLVNNGKMSKSLRNTYTVAQLEEMGYKPMVFRLFCLNAQYRKKLNFTFEGLDGAKISYNRLLSTLQLHKFSDVKTDKEVLATYEKDFYDAVTDDLNVPKALGILFTMTKENKSKDIYDLAQKFDKVFGVNLSDLPEVEKVNVPAEVEELAQMRLVARQNKDFGKSDSLRAEINNLGYQVKDVKDGFEITKL